MGAFFMGLRMQYQSQSTAMNASTENLMKGATLALNRGDYKQLHALCMQVLKFDTAVSDAWFFLGLAAGAQNQVGKAIEFFGRALNIQPDNSEYHGQKARFHTLLNQNDKALDSANAALALAPKRALELDSLGVVYTKIGEYELARNAFGLAVAKEPKNFQYQFNLGSAEQFLGHIQEARDAYQRAIDMNPTFARAHWVLSELEKNRSDEKELTQLQDLIATPRLSIEDELYLSHALNRELERKDDYEQAFTILQSAKQRRRDMIGYSIDADKRLFESLHESFPLDMPAAKVECSQGEEAIFIVGMPRSGTTLIERILASHSDVHSLGELQDFARSVKKESNTLSPVVLDDGVVRRAVIGNAGNIGLRYLQSIEARRQKEKYFIDKMPLNFFNVGFIVNALPAAKILCVRRHPLDTCLSNFRQLFALDFSYYNYHYDIEDTARYYVEFDRLMAHWQSLYPGRFVQISYEELTANPEAQAKQLFSTLGLSWQPQCLDFHTSKAAVSTASAIQVGEPIYRTAVGRWEKYAEQLKPAIRILEEAGIAL
jgi:tetratricopeptide (TPR) repeat protein